jgi:hypothetical protein
LQDDQATTARKDPMKIGSSPPGGIDNTPDSEHTIPATQPQRVGPVAGAPFHEPARSRTTSEAQSLPGTSASLRGLRELQPSSLSRPFVKVPSAGATDAGASIKNALLNAVNSPGTRVLVVSHSPPDLHEREVHAGAPDAHHAASSDGMPHLLGAVGEAARDGTLKAGSAVVLHLPARWLREQAVSALIGQLREKQVSVVVAQVNDAVYGDFLVGRSDNSLPPPYRVGTPRPGPAGAPTVSAPAVSHVGGVPRVSVSARPQVSSMRTRVTDVTQCAMPTTADSLGNVPMLSTTVLMKSLQQLIGPARMQSRVGFLSDDADYERKSARDCGVKHSMYFDRGKGKMAVDTEGVRSSAEDVFARLFEARG